MAKNFEVVQGNLASAVANAGTFTVGYPTGTLAGTFQNGINHKLVIAENSVLTSPNQFSLTFGSSNITVTNASGSTWPANATFYLQLDIAGGNFVGSDFVSATDGVVPAPVQVINLGNPIAGASNNILTSSAITAASGVTLNGSLVTSGVATVDVPRNIVAAWTNTAVMTVTGTDAYGNVVKESSASGTSFTGKKAFKTVTSVTVSADVTGATVGTGNVLGLPIALPAVGLVVAEIEDNAKATAGTIVAAAAAKATATTGDVRGTYAPNSTPDGSKVFRLVAALPDPTFKGVSQFAG